MALCMMIFTQVSGLDEATCYQFVISVSNNIGAGQDSPRSEEGCTVYEVVVTAPTQSDPMTMIIVAAVVVGVLVSVGVVVLVLLCLCCCVRLRQRSKQNLPERRYPI